MNKKKFFYLMYLLLCLFMIVFIFSRVVMSATHHVHYVTDLDTDVYHSDNIVTTATLVSTTGGLVNITDCEEHFSATQDDYEPAAWTIKDTANPLGSVFKDEFLGWSDYGFADVLVLQDNDNTDDFSATYGFSAQLSGTIEFWFLLYDDTAFDDNSYEHQFVLGSGYETLFAMEIEGNDREVKIRDDLGAFNSIDEYWVTSMWQHILIDFDEYGLDFYRDGNLLYNGSWIDNYAGGVTSFGLYRGVTGFGNIISIDSFDVSWSDDYYRERITDFQQHMTAFYYKYFALPYAANYHYVYNISYTKNQHNYITFRFQTSENNVTFNDWSAQTISSEIAVYSLTGEYFYVEFNFSSGLSPIYFGDLIIDYYYTDDYYDQAWSIWDAMNPVINILAILFIVPLSFYSDKKERWMVFPLFILMVFIAFFAGHMNQLVFMVTIIISILVLILKYRRGGTIF